MTFERFGGDPRGDAAAALELESVGCPLGCGTGDEPVVQGFDRLTGGPGRYQVVRCQNCGLMRTNPRPTGASIGIFYPDDYAP